MWYWGVVAVYLEEIDVVGPQRFQGKLAGADDVEPRVPLDVRRHPRDVLVEGDADLAGRVIDLGRYENLVAAPAVGKGLPDNRFTRPSRVEVSGVDEIDAGIKRTEDKRLGELGRGAVAEVVRAEADGRYLHAGAPEIPELHAAAPPNRPRRNALTRSPSSR